MQRPPNDGRGAGAAQQPSAQPQKGTASSAKPTQRGMPAAHTPQSKSGTSNAQPSSGSSKVAPVAAPPASGPRVAAGAAPAQAPAAASPAVVVTRPIDVGATAPAASARGDSGGRPASAASRPAMPAISIGPPTAAAPAASPPAAKAVAAPPGEARNSVRPTAPEMMTSGPSSNGQASIADTFERLLSSEDLDAGFASMERPAATPGAHSAAMSDLAEVRILFAQLAANHVRQVRDFMIDLRWSDATIDWIPICEPALRSLRRAADKLELDGALRGARSILRRARRGDGERREGHRRRTARETLLARYEELSRADAAGVRARPRSYAARGRRSSSRSSCRCPRSRRSRSTRCTPPG